MKTTLDDKEVPQRQPYSIIPLFHENSFNPFDSVRLATLALQTFVISVQNFLQNNKRNIQFLQISQSHDFVM